VPIDRDPPALSEYVTRHCPYCRQEMPQIPTVTSEELRAIRTGVGIKLWYHDLSFPINLFGHMCGVSERTMTYYLRGERAGKPVRIPLRVAVRARELQAMNRGQLLAMYPHKAEEKRVKRLRRKSVWAKRKLARDRRLGLNTPSNEGET
jgi:hypothetical protein